MIHIENILDVCRNTLFEHLFTLNINVIAQNKTHPIFVTNCKSQSHARRNQAHLAVAYVNVS